MPEHERDPSPPAAQWQERTVGENLRRRREELGISQRDLADRMRDLGYDWHHNTVRRTETATRPIRVGELMGLAGILRVGLMELIATERESKADDLQARLALTGNQIRELTKYLGAAQARQVQARQDAELAARAVEMAEQLVAKNTDEMHRARAIQEESAREASALQAELDSLHVTLAQLKRALHEVTKGTSDDLRPGDKVDLSAHVSGARIIQDGDDYHFELVDPAGKLAVRSGPLPSRDIAYSILRKSLDEWIDVNYELKEGPPNAFVFHLPDTEKRNAGSYKRDTRLPDADLDTDADITAFPLTANIDADITISPAAPKPSDEAKD